MKKYAIYKIDVLIAVAITIMATAFSAFCFVVAPILYQLTYVHGIVAGVAATILWVLAAISISGIFKAEVKTGE